MRVIRSYNSSLQGYPQQKLPASGTAGAVQEPVAFDIQDHGAVCLRVFIYFIQSLGAQHCWAQRLK